MINIQSTQQLGQALRTARKQLVLTQQDGLRLAQDKVPVGASPATNTIE